MYTNIRFPVTGPMACSFTKGNIDKTVALIDIDDTLGPMCQLIVEWAAKHYSLPKLTFTFKNWGMQGLADDIGIPLEDFFVAVKASRVMENFKFHPTANSVLNVIRNGQLLNKEYHIALVTKRYGFWHDAINLTRNQVASQNIIHDSLHIIDYGLDKYEWAKDYFGDKLKVVIEDCPNTLRSAIDDKIIVLKVNQSYNGHVLHNDTICFKQRILSLDNIESHIV